MKGKMYGYIRVSTREQNEDRQLIAMRQFGVLDAQIVMDSSRERISNVPATKSS